MQRRRPPLWKRQPRLHTRIGLAFGLLIIAVAFGLAVAMARTAEKQVLSQSSANLESLSGQMARELAGGMDRFAQAVVTQTYRDRFRDPKSTAASMRGALDQFKATNPEFAYVSIIDIGAAKVLAASGGIFEGGDASGRPTFERGKNGVFVGDVHDAVRLAELLPKPVNGEALRFLDVAAPIADPSGRIFRVFASHVAWAWTDSVRQDIFAPVARHSGVEAFLVDTRGKIVLAAAPALKVGSDLQGIARLQGQPAAVLAWPDGGDYLTVVSGTDPHGHFPGFGWRVVVRQPVATAAAAASSLRTAFLIGALLLGTGGAAVAWMVVGRLTRPMRLLTEAAGRVEAGAPLETVLPPHAGDSEFSVVQTAMVRLADTARFETEARALSRRQFEVLAGSLPEVVFQTDATGRVAYVNQAWVAGNGTEAAGSAGAGAGAGAGADGTADAAVNSGTGADAGFGLHDLARRMPHPQERRAFEEAWRACLASGDDLRLRCRLQAAGNNNNDDSLPARPEPRWFDIAARAVRSDTGAIITWVGTLFDVHDIVTRAEQADRALDQERAARLEAERIARMKDEFLATVSHELRSPLSVITGWSDILRRKGSDNPMVLKAAEIIRINARLQTGLINDLLDITAVIAGKLTLDAEPLDLAQLASEAALSHLTAAQTKGVALVCQAPAPCWVTADRRRMMQIISNLLGNAIKFTDAGGRIELAVALPAGGQTACLTVRDTGRGIAADFLPHVFERMRQEDASKTRRAGGLGLGLAIVRGLAELHDGTVQAASEGPGRGAVFSLCLPLLMPESLDTADEAALAAMARRQDDDEENQVSELQGRRILLVDDEADAREVAQVALSSLGAEVRVASSGAEVLTILERERFDALVSDIGMPEMNGLTLIRQIRARESGAGGGSPGGAAGRPLPAVALSAFAMESDRAAGLQAGFQAYVAKPISLRRLSEAVARSIETAQAA